MKSEKMEIGENLIFKLCKFNNSIKISDMACKLIVR